MAIQNEHRRCSRRPKTVVTQENINEILDMVLNERRLKLREIAKAIGISSDRAFHILHKELDMKNSPQDECRVCSL